jgi:hypothetical protein
VLRPDGSRKIGHRSAEPIDATIALLLANYLADFEPVTPFLVAWSA